MDRRQPKRILVSTVSVIGVDRMDDTNNGGQSLLNDSPAMSIDEGAAVSVTSMPVKLLRAAIAGLAISGVGYFALASSPDLSRSFTELTGLTVVDHMAAASSAAACDSSESCGMASASTGCGSGCGDDACAETAACPAVGDVASCCASEASCPAGQASCCASEASSECTACPAGLASTATEPATAEVDSLPPEVTSAD